MHLLIPSTYGIDERDDKLQVWKIGVVARTASIFGVDQITIFKDHDPKADEERNATILEKYLTYAECPPYLRKALIPHDPDLQYANILPALQTLSHGYTDEFREAVVTESRGNESVLNAGLEDPVTVPEPVPEGERVTLQMLDETTGKVIDHSDIDGFWTFTVENRRDDLGTILDTLSTPVIGTSRKGEPLSTFAASRLLHDDIAVVFGSPWRGIPDLIERGDCTDDQFAGTYNFMPGQHTRTVRTGEAIPMVFSVINALRAV